MTHGTLAINKPVLVVCDGLSDEVFLRDLWEGRIDPVQANRKLIDLIVKASNRRARLEGREGERDESKQSAG